MLILTSAASGQSASSFRFNNLNTEDGLPNNTITSIVQDSFGFTWIGTNDGLARYESTNTFTLFRKDNAHPKKSLASNHIRSLFVDSHHNLWIGTIAGGLSRFHQETQQWETYRHEKGNPTSLSNDDILCIEEDSGGRLWIGTERGLNVFQPESNSFVRFNREQENPEALQNRAILDIHEDKQGWLWLATWGGGLHLMLPDKEIAQSTFRQFLPSDDLSSYNAWCVYQDAAENHWLGTNGGGLYLMNLPKNASNQKDPQDWHPTFTHFKHDLKRPGALSNEAVADILQDQQGHLWIGTSNGLSLLDSGQLSQISQMSPSEINAEDFHFEVAYNLPNNPYSLNNSNVSNLFEDRNGMLWVGTLSGLSIYNPFGNKFEVWDLSDHDELGNIERIYANSAEDIALFTDDGPIKYNLKTQKLTEIPGIREKYDDGKITEIHDHDKYFYMSSLKHIYKYDVTTAQTRIYEFPDLASGLENLYIRAMHKDKEGRMWIGTTLGLFLLNETNGEFKRVGSEQNTDQTLADNSITQIVEDTYGNLWFSTWAGLSRFVGENNGAYSFENFGRTSGKARAALCSDQVMAMLQIDTILYLGTSNGICSYNYHTGELRSEGSDDNKFFVHGLERDDSGNLWVSTNEGIYCYTPGSGQMRHFEIADGLSDLAFRLGSSYRDPKGYIYFGSRWGFTRFHPDEIYRNTVAPVVHLTHMRKVSRKADETLSLTVQEEIELDHDDYLLSLSFAAPSYIRPEKNRYAYKLEGLDKEWQINRGDLTATYTNLAQGTYTFRVKAANNDGLWNDVETTLKVIVRPAFWQTRGFYLACFLLGIYLLWQFVKYYTKNILHRNRTLQTLNQDLNNEVATRKKIQATLEERELHMEKLVDARTQELAIKKEEIEVLLQKVTGRNEKLEELVELRTKKLTESNQELTRSNRDLEQFAYVASHDLKEPLRTVGTFVDLFRRKYNAGLDNDGREYLDFVTDGVFRMSNLINSLLTYSRVGRKEMEFFEVDLNTVIQNKLEDLSKLIEERAVSVEVGTLPKILCSRNQMGMVFYNLINNAIKFNNNKHPSVKIESPRSSDPHFWKFSISDNGIGIEAEYQDQIFEIFRRLHNKQDYEGTGIGLALCKKIINRHGGNIWLDSTPGQGTKFYFTIRKDLEQATVLTKELAEIDNQG